MFGRGASVDRNLIVKNISKYYKVIKANDNISIEFKTQQITALIGHNGVGKTTLLNQMNGLIVPTKGTIYLNDINIVKEYRRARLLISSMPQFQVPLKGVTTFQAIQTIAMIKGVSNKLAKKKTENLISFLQLEKWKDISGDQLSGGLQRLTSFAMSVVDEAPVILLDEPTNDVDPIRRILMWKHLRKLADKGHIIIIVTHNLLEVEKYADRYILLDKGCVKKDVEVKSNYINDIKHVLCIYDIEHDDIILFSKIFKIKYDMEQKILTIPLLEKDIRKALSVLWTVLKDRKATKYELKLQNLYDNYEDIIYE